MRYHSDADMIAQLEKHIEDAGGVRAFARLHGCSASWVSKVRLGQTPFPSGLASIMGYCEAGRMWVKQKG